MQSTLYHLLRDFFHQQEILAYTVILAADYSKTTATSMLALIEQDCDFLYDVDTWTKKTLDLVHCMGVEFPPAFLSSKRRRIAIHDE